MKGERGNTHSTRNGLSEYIVENPGVSFSTLLNAFGLNESTLRYHLDYLLKSGEITTCRTGTSKRFFPTYSSRTAIEGNRPEPMSRSDARVLDIIKSTPGISRSELKAHVPLTSKELTTSLTRLKERYMIWEQRENGRTSYEVVTREKVLKNALVLIVGRLLEGEIDEATFLRLKDEIERQLKDIRTE
jgi:predicted transcriptional regulator